MIITSWIFKSYDQLQGFCSKSLCCWHLFSVTIHITSLSHKTEIDVTSITFEVTMNAAIKLFLRKCFSFLW